MKVKDWEATKREIEKDNLLQSRTASRAKRTYQELSQRLKVLTDDELELLIEGDLQEQKYLLWFNVCSYYQFIHDFAVEVVHEKFLRMDYQLTDFDYSAFYNTKSDDHPELEKITNSTKDKLREVILRMLREAGITNDEARILPALLSNRLINSLKRREIIELRIYPMVVQ